MRAFNELDPSIKSAAIMTGLYADEFGMTPEEMDSVWALGIAGAIRARHENAAAHPWLERAFAHTNTAAQVGVA